MLRPVNAIIRDNVGNIIHRGFVVTGEVATDNGDGSYDVYIAGETKAYPRVFTLARNPDLKVGDTVRILYKNGCKELPIILPPVKPTAPPITYNIAYLYYAGSNHYLVILDKDGNILKNIVHSTSFYSTSGDPVAVDSDNNIYIAGKWANKIKKIDRNGNLLKEISVITPEQIAISSNNDLWVHEWPSDNYFVKRDKTTLAKLDEIHIGYGNFAGMAFDSEGYLYTINWSDKQIEKWSVVNKTRVTYRALPTGKISDRAIYSSLAVIGSTVYLTQWANDEGDIFTCPTNLSSNFTANNVDEDFPQAADYVNLITASGGTHIIVEGYVSNVKTIVKYDTNFNRVWKVQITDSGIGLGIAAWPF